MATQALNVLISAKVQAYVREVARSRYGLDQIHFIPYSGQRLDDQTLAQVDIAFVSRDITGRSTKYVLDPATDTFYRMMEQAPNLQWVHVHSAGVDRPVYVSLRDKGLKVTSSTGALSGIVAQSVLAAVLALNRRFRFLEQAQRDHIWAPLLDDLMPADLQGQHVVLAGWGPIGQTIQRYLGMLGMRVTVLRNSAVTTPTDIPMIPYDAMHRILPETDWMILACPLTETTRRLIDRKALDAMKPGACIVNVSRGEVIDEAALIDALRKGHIAGAYLDVVEKEPLESDSPLWDMPSVIVSPHTAGHSIGNEARVADIFLENLNNWVRGQPLRNLSR
ncbi:D-2-hydroxyacid dehydrogenase [Advenella sp. FME57]|uniref:D-2-hydroxyacid dehydrogenase n=1 Tax=Advenella sp. FME57 TaxID=2742604 RepID=UPI001867DF3D|nr:D-2-hydroxyacid dehydrogenase [Advenella sp. FME57]